MSREYRLPARERFLASVWRELASSLDCEVALARVARLAVPECADWCFLRLADEAAVGRLVEVAYANPEWASLAERLRRSQPPAATSARRPSPKIVLVPNVNNSRLARVGTDQEHLELLKGIATRSFLVVPIGVCGRPFAMLTFAYTPHSGRRYGTDDIVWALNVGARAGLGIERAMLRRQLETSTLVKEEFLAALSYELEHPLNATAGYFRLLESDALDLALRSRATAAVERNVALLRRLVDDLLDAARTASGTLKLQMTPLLVSHVVQDVVNTVLPTARAKGVAVRCVIEPLAGSVLADPNRLWQVTWNLLSNAIKFTPAGGHVVVRVERRESQVEIIVADSGVGIPSDLLPRVFEPFWQEDARFSRIHGGLGLGLALVRRIVELHGGTARAASSGPGRGATFTVALQRLRDSKDEEAASNTSIARIEGLRVLLVDDDRDWIEFAVDLLTLAGGRVFVERAGPAALTRLETECPHVLLVDIGLPRMDACEFIAGVRRSDATYVRSVRAAAVSGHASPDLRQRALTAGFQMFLSKSPVAEDLLDAVIQLAAMGVDTRPAS